MRDYNGLKKEALEILGENLSERLHYHGLAHTLDVLAVCEQYISRDKIEDGKADLLRIGALLHDIGFTISTTQHEEHSAALAGPIMEKYGYPPADVEVVKGLIRSTRVPQRPENHLEEIICDSDLDYLGRDDFYRISNKLFEELKSFSVVSNQTEWNQRQVEFLKAHHYHTLFAKTYRQPKKEQRIKEIQNWLDQGR